MNNSFTSSHLHNFTTSHLHNFTSSHLHNFTMKPLFPILILLFAFSAVYAQNVTNVSFHQEGNKVIIMYDLDRQADVSVYMSSDGGNSFGGALQHVTGAVGKSVPAGTGKRIEYDPLAEYDKLQGENFVFKVSASAQMENAIVNGVPFEMVLVEGGTFTMGATSEQGSEAESDEKPAHRVTVGDFYIGKYEVTQAQWKAVMGSNPSCFKGDDLPVENVSWNDVQEFIRKLNALTGRTYRLPTEAEWEYAARGGNKSQGYKYAGSNNIETVAWYYGNSGSKTHPVGGKSPNELGLYDMSGNVFEWCSDWYGSYSSGSLTNPQGPSSGSGRVLRGGSWGYYSGSCRVSFRNYDYPGSGGLNLGFRLVLVP